MALPTPLHGIEITYLRASADLPAHWLIEAYRNGVLLEDTAASHSHIALGLAGQFAAKYTLPIRTEPTAPNTRSDGSHPAGLAQGVRQ